MHQHQLCRSEPNVFTKFSFVKGYDLALKMTTESDEYTVEDRKRLLGTHFFFIYKI